MSDEEIIPPIEVTIAAGATLNSSARASTFRKRKIHVNDGKYKQRETVARPRPQGKETKQALGMAWKTIQNVIRKYFLLLVTLRSYRSQQMMLNYTYNVMFWVVIYNKMTGNF